MSKIGGMQRAGVDLLAQLELHGDLEVSTLVLRSTGWRHYLLFPPFILSSLYRIRSAIRRGQVDAVLFSAMPSATMAALLGPLAKRSNVPLLAIAHGHDVIASNALYQILLRRVFAQLSGVLPVSSCTAAACVARGLDPAAVFVTPNGINPERFGTASTPPPSTREDRRAVLHQTLPNLAAKLPREALVLCSVGRQVKRKGHEWFIRTVMQRLEPNAQLILGGTGPEAANIARAISETAMTGRVHLLGLVPEEKLAGLYSGADLFVMPNIPIEGDMEGFGITMLEAGLCALPSISTRIEGIQDVITEGVNGYTVTSMGSGAYAERINSFAQNPNLLNALSASAHKHTLASFSWPVIADNMVSTINSTIARVRAAN